MILEDKRIFIVEDNLSNRAIMQLLLEQQGAVVAFERWGRDTVEALKQFAPVHLILLDLMFPNNISGYDVYDRIREVAEFADIPVLAVSAMEPEIAIPRTRDKGFAGFIAKPIKFQSFAEQVKAVINGEKLWMAE